jgi:surface polysaccharide O-acyltransferase-like enzyme
MSLILGMYILIPIVAIGLSKVSTKILMFPVMIFTVYSFLFPTLLTILEILHVNPGYSVNFSLGFSGGAGGLFIIYGYLLKKGLLKKIKTWVLAIIFVVTFFLGDAFQFWAYSNGVTYNMGYVNVLQLIASLALFEIMSRIIIQKESLILTAISKFSFPIYLIHNIFICMCLPFVLAMELANPAKVVILYFLCFIAAFALAKVISLIPKVGKFILYLK